MAARRTQPTAVAELLIAAYNAEIETVINYLANSVYLDGVRADVVKRSLAAEVTAELGHATLLANRIKILGGSVPGSIDLAWTQESLQPPTDSTDVVAVVRGVIEAEQSAIEAYRRIIKACEGDDYVTQDLAITILGDEQEHLRLYQGYLADLSKR